MDASFRVDQEPGVGVGVARAALLAALALLLGGCSMLSDALPGGDGAVHGAVLSDDYALEIEALSNQRMQLASLDEAPEPAALRSPALGQRYVPGEVLVQYRPTARSVSALSLVPRAPQSVPLGTHEDVAAAVSRLSREPDVLLASPNYYVYTTALPDDPYLPQQWSLPAAGLPVTWGETGGHEVTVAVIDSGFDLDHQDLQGVFLPGYDFCANSDCSANDADPGHGSEGNWHGTHVAGVVAAAGDNGVGVKGVADGSPVRVLPVKIFNDQGGGASTRDLIEGLRWAAGLPVEGAPPNPHPARVINLSLAGDFSSDVLQPTLDAVRATGALVVAATGNAGVDRVMSPAAAAGVVAVGSINSRFERSCFSNYGVGPHGPGGVDIVAPGGEADGSVVSCGIGPYGTEGLMSSIPGDGYGSAVGTSMAAPMVSGTAALILSRQPDLSVTELEALLLEAAYFDAGEMTRSEYGAGVLRADKALGYLGPGDEVLVELEEPESGAQRTLPLTLGLAATGAGFSFEGIAPGSYELRAEEPGSGRLLGRLDLAVAPGEEVRANLVLEVVR